MPLKPSTQKVQKELANFCRSGKYTPLNGVKSERAEVYRDLIYNQIESALESGYPITYELLKGKRWDSLINDFLLSHSCSTPYLWSMPKELYLFAKKNEYHKQLKLPYFIELLYFEWLEIEVFMMPDKQLPSFRTDGHLLEDRLILNPEHRLDRFEYPVFKQSAHFLEENKREYFLLTYRHPESKQVHFFELSLPFLIAIELLKVEPLTIEETVEACMQYCPVPSLKEASVLFQSLINQRAILGFEK